MHTAQVNKDSESDIIFLTNRSGKQFAARVDVKPDPPSGCKTVNGKDVLRDGDSVLYEIDRQDVSEILVSQAGDFFSAQGGGANHGKKFHHLRGHVGHGSLA